MSTTETPPYELSPNYTDGFPQMPTDGFASNTDFDLGWLSGLNKTAFKSLDQIYGSYNFSFSENDLLDFSNVSFGDTFTETKGAIIYIGVWFAFSIVFTIVGLCWCCSNCCCCCCRSSYKGKTKDEYDDADPHRPLYSQRNKKRNIPVGAIVLTVFMAIWLMALLLVILFAFGGNKEINNTLDNLVQEVDLNNTIEDVVKFLDITSHQLNFMFNESFEKFKNTTLEIPKFCQDNTGAIQNLCGEIETNLAKALNDSEDEVLQKLGDLRKALEDFRKQVDIGKEQLDENDQYKQIKDILGGDGLYWVIMIFNLLYCLVFALVLIGTLLAVAARTSGLKTAGYLTIRAGIVVMFILVFFIVCQMIVMFAIGGIPSQIICPALKQQEDLGVSPAVQAMIADEGDEERCGASTNEFEIPKYGEIMTKCKNDSSSYVSFNMKSAYDVNCLKSLTSKFNQSNLIPDLPTTPLPTDLPTITPPTFPTAGPDFIDPFETVRAIEHQINKYLEFLIKSVETDLGKCKPVYKAVNATINLFCNKLPAPLVSLWWILQFIPPLFLLMILTALFLERIHF